MHAHGVVRGNRAVDEREGLVRAGVASHVLGGDVVALPPVKDVALHSGKVGLGIDGVEHGENLLGTDIDTSNRRAISLLYRIRGMYQCFIRRGRFGVGKEGSYLRSASRILRISSAVIRVRNFSLRLRTFSSHSFVESLGPFTARLICSNPCCSVHTSAVGAGVLAGASLLKSSLEGFIFDFDGQRHDFAILYVNMTQRREQAVLIDCADVDFLGHWGGPFDADDSCHTLKCGSAHEDTKAIYRVGG